MFSFITQIILKTSQREEKKNGSKEFRGVLNRCGCVMFKIETTNVEKEKLKYFD